MSYRAQIVDALKAGSLTAVRWLTAPLIVFLVMGVLAFGGYDYYVTRTATRQIATAINSGQLLQILGQQQQAAAAKQQSGQQPK